MADFQNPPLGDMVAVGAVGPCAVRIWLRVRQAGPVTVSWWQEDTEGKAGELTVQAPGQGDPGDGTLSLELPPRDWPPLEPLTRYRFRATDSQGRLVGEGRFCTAPAGPQDTPRKFSIAFYSCHQPFDNQGKVRDEARQMLTALNRTLDRHDTPFVLEVGDQMYSDLPGELSLFEDDHFARVAPSGAEGLLDCSSEQVRRLYQRRYRHFWNVPGWPELHARYPCYPILDDHDIVDNWGSHPDHKEERWQRFFRGARRAYQDYQGSRVLADGAVDEPTLHYQLSYGHTSLFVMDLRSERQAGEGGQLFSDRQDRALREFLVGSRQQKVVILVLSVPIIHLPRTLARLVSKLPPQGEDFSDRWSSGRHLGDRDRVLKMLRHHQRHCPDQKLILLSGDIHIGCLHRMNWDDGGAPFYQFTSSPLTHHNSLFVRWGSKRLIKLNRGFVTQDHELKARVELLPGTGRQTKNPYGKLNFGMVEVETPEEGGPPIVRFLLYGHREGEPVCVYRSPEL